MKKIILSLLLVVTTCSFAQSSFKGTLVSPDQKPISAANVILMSLPDSILVKGAISNQRGVFELPNAAEGKKNTSQNYPFGISNGGIHPLGE